MIKIQPEIARATGGAGSAALRVANRLSLAAAPTFAVMALATALGGAADAVCVAEHHASPFTGMAAMYVLMSAFHLTPWLRLISRWRSSRGGSNVSGRLPVRT
jgi:hypothetical protein